MNKHTPGPWEVTGPQIDAPTSDGGVWSIALVNVRNDAYRANARLIAAAPDLLEACELIAVAYDNNDWSEPGVSDALYGAIECVRAAITQARGEAL